MGYTLMASVYVDHEGEPTKTTFPPSTPFLTHSLFLPQPLAGILDAIATGQKTCDSSSQLKLTHTHTTPGGGREEGGRQHRQHTEGVRKKRGAISSAVTVL